jgi:cytochrome c oxidase subunit II
MAGEPTPPRPPEQAPPATGADRDIPHGRRVLKLWAVLSVICIVIVILLRDVVNPAPGSSDASFAVLTNVLFTALAVPVALFVWVFVGYSMVVFRERRRAGVAVEELEDGPALQATPRQQIAWLAITGGLAIFLVGWGMFGFYKQTVDPPAKPLVVRVTGQQWMWTYAYPSLGVQSDVLYLPVGRPVQFRITSLDVLHGFVIDGLAVAMDANPGWWTVAPTVTPTKLGNYAVRCVELCGLYHTFMWSRVKVVSASAFAAWAAANRGFASTARS